MAKLGKFYFYNSRGEKKVNCYKINLSKELIKTANISEDDELNIYVKGGKIIIEKVAQGE